MEGLLPLRDSQTSTKCFSVPTPPPKATLRKAYSSLLLRHFPDGPTEKLWREFLTRVDCPTHYDSPEFFVEPYWKVQKPFALLLLYGSRVVAAITGFDQGREILSGLKSRPQISFSRDADVGLSSTALADALVSHFPNAKLFTVYTWGSRDLPGFVTRGFRKLELEGCVSLDLRQDANSMFYNFPSNRRRDIRKAMRNGIEVKEATTDADLEAYWSVYAAWKGTARKKLITIGISRRWPRSNKCALTIGVSWLVIRAKSLLQRRFVSIVVVWSSLPTTVRATNICTSVRTICSSGG